MNIIHKKTLYSEYWYYLGKDNKEISHRDNDLPAVIYTNGNKYWCQHGKRHRETGVAIEYFDGELEYWYHGQFLGSSFNGYTQKDFENFKKYKMFL